VSVGITSDSQNLLLGVHRRRLYLLDPDALGELPRQIGENTLGFRPAGVLPVSHPVPASLHINPQQDRRFRRHGQLLRIPQNSRQFPAASPGLGLCQQETVESRECDGGRDPQDHQNYDDLDKRKRTRHVPARAINPAPDSSSQCPHCRRFHRLQRPCHRTPDRSHRACRGTRTDRDYPRDPREPFPLQYTLPASNP